MASAPAVAAVEAPVEPESPAETPPEVAVRFTDVSKTFRIPVDRAYTLKERVLRPRSSRRVNELEALKNVSFEIEKGEFFGIIGRNGSGKSTLLKCLAGIYQPTSGKIEVAGRISPFLELGVGFSPELTAKENVVLNASLIGISPKVARAGLDEIIAFAELEEFVELKHKNYSSGMAMRLAFASAIQAHADILLIDEALAVGDDPFKEKCYKRFEEMKEEGRTIVFVSHALSLVNRFCDRVLLLDRGDVVELGESRPTVAVYQERNRAIREAEEAAAEAAAEPNGTVAQLEIKAAPPAEPAESAAASPVVEAVPPRPEPVPVPVAELAPEPQAEPAAVPSPEPEPEPAPAAAEPEPAEPPPATPPEPEPEPDPEPVTEPNVIASEPEPLPAPPPAPAAPAPPEAATITALWMEDGRGAAPQLLPQSLDTGTLHVRVSFPKAMQEPVFGVIVSGATGEPVYVEHSLRDDLRPGALERDAAEPYSVRFYVHAGHLLYIASVAIRAAAPIDDEFEDETVDGGLEFSVHGMKRPAGWGQDLPEFGVPDASRAAALTLGGPKVPTVGDAWLQSVDGHRDRVFYQGHEATLHAAIARPGEAIANLARPAEPPSSKHTYSIGLYAYTDVGHYSTSVSVSR